MTSALRSHRRPSTTLLKRLIDAPDLVRIVEALPPRTFSALVRRIGVEDSAEIVALASTEQLVEAFDEDLFNNERAGERESFDAERFVTWLEILLEAGDAVAAQRVAELAEPFVVQALSSVVIVLDHDSLLQSLSDDSDDARVADKVIESSLSQEIDGYLLLSRKQEGWDAAVALILALDRDHRALLERLLERCADLASPYLEDLAELSVLLTEEEALAEEVESEREGRRAERGFVEPRAARAFLKLAQEPLGNELSNEKRDPLTYAYFRDLPSTPVSPPIARDSSELPKVVREVLEELAEPMVSAPSHSLPRAGSLADTADSDELPLMLAMRALSERDEAAFSRRVEELAYLANVILAGAEKELDRFAPTEAAEAALATVSLGAELVAREDGRTRKGKRAQTDALCDVLKAHSADLLFRRACSAMRGRDPTRAAFLRSRAELEAALEEL